MDIKDADCRNLRAESTVKVHPEKMAEVRECFCGAAHDAIGELEHGANIFGFTKGQFSLMDLIIEMVSQVGPCHVDLSTWTAAHADLEAAYQFLKRGELESIRFVVDRSFPTRQPEYCRKLADRFGGEAVRVTRTHAKFCALRNDTWDLVCFTSMNLNQNPRFEDFLIVDDANIASYIKRVVDEIFERQEVGAAFEGSTTSEDDQFRSFVLDGDVTSGQMDFDLPEADWTL